MSFVYDVVVVLHLLGMAALIGGWMTQLRVSGDRTVSATVLYGAATQVVTGLVLVGLASTVVDDQAVDNVKIGVKLLIALVVLVLAGANRRRSSVTSGAYAVIGGLAVLNVAIAVLW